jgi:hypothetical protein
MIVLFSAGGRTGNQLFQIAYAISNRRGAEWLVTFGLGRTKSMLADGPWKRNWMNVEHRILAPLLEAILYTTAYYALVKTGLVSLHADRRSVPIVRRGKIPFLVMMKGYFESPQLHARNLAEFFRLKETILAKVRPVLAALPQGSVPVFVHVRRGDLVDHVPKEPSDIKRMVPDSYYQEAVSMFLRRHPRSFFLVVGDDPDHAEALFSAIDTKLISRRSAAEDLALMSLCDGGVLSNSTFAWWGAFFGTHKLGCTIPKYWSGWAAGVWDPPAILASFMTDVIEVLPSDVPCTIGPAERERV